MTHPSSTGNSAPHTSQNNITMINSASNPTTTSTPTARARPQQAASNSPAPNHGPSAKPMSSTTSRTSRPALHPSNSSNYNVIPATGPSLSGPNQYTRQVEVYTLPDAAERAIPEHVRSRYQRDEWGRVLWFTAPGREAPGVARHPRHSDDYMEKKAARDELRSKRKAEIEASHDDGLGKRPRDCHADDAVRVELEALKQRALAAWVDQMEAGTELLMGKVARDPT